MKNRINILFFTRCTVLFLPAKSDAILKCNWGKTKAAGTYTELTGPCQSCLYIYLYMHKCQFISYIIGVGGHISTLTISQFTVDLSNFRRQEFLKAFGGLS